MKIKPFSLLPTALFLSAFLLLFAQSAVSAAPADLKKSVAVVYNRLDATTVSNLEDYSIWLSRLGKRQESRILSYLCKDGFGSGFVVTDGINGLYLLTNSHVVGIGIRADVAFIDGTDTLRFDACECVFQDDHADLALLRLPTQAAGAVEPLRLTETVLQEGGQVFTAGFPALANRPSWQFGQGIISNTRLLFPEMEHYYIQHTGQIDKGSSGSPLLVRAADGSYEVAGVNTLKIREREAVGMAVPVEMIRQALANMGTNTFHDALLAIDTLPVNTYMKIYEHVPESVIEQQNRLFEEGYVIEGLALVPAYNDTAKLVTVAQRNAKKIKSDTRPYEGPQASNKKDKVLRNDVYGLDEDLYHTRTFYLTSDFYFPNLAPLFIGIGSNFTIANYVRMGFNAQFAKSVESSVNLKGLYLSYLVGVQVPVSLGNFEIIPYLTPDIGMSIFFVDDIAGSFNAGGKLGADFGIKVKEHFFYIGAEYDLMWMISKRTSGIIAPGARNGLGVHLGIGF